MDRSRDSEAVSETRGAPVDRQRQTQILIYGTALQQDRTVTEMQKFRNNEIKFRNNEINFVITKLNS